MFADESSITLWIGILPHVEKGGRAAWLWRGAGKICDEALCRCVNAFAICQHCCGVLSCISDCYISVFLALLWRQEPCMCDSFMAEIEHMRRRSEANLRNYSARDKMQEAAEQEKVTRAYGNLGIVFHSVYLTYYVRWCQSARSALTVFHRYIYVPIDGEDARVRQELDRRQSVSSWSFHIGSQLGWFMHWHVSMCVSADAISA